jgi:Leucine-rich repeat (LRR) protein
MSSNDTKEHPPIGVLSNNEEDFADEYHPHSPAVGGNSNGANDENIQAPAAAVNDSDLSVARSTEMPHPITLEHADARPVLARRNAVTPARGSGVPAQRNRDAVPGAFLVSQAGTIATQRSLTESRRAVVIHEVSQTEDVEARSIPRVDEESGTGGNQSNQGDYFIAEASAVEEDIAIAQVATQKWYQRRFYRSILIGSVLLTCVLVGIVIALLSRPTGNAPTMSPPPTTSALSSTLEAELIACVFIAQASLSDCRLQRTVLETKGLTIPSEIGLLTKLTYLSLENAELTGTIPTTIGELTELEYLSFSSNSALMGAIPSSIGDLVRLTYLSFAKSGLTGSIPSSVGSLKQLQHLDLALNAFTGAIPLSIGEPTLLTHLVFASNQLTGGIPSSIESLRQLTYLDFGINKLNGTVPDFIGGLTKLNALGLYRNGFTGNIPPSIVGLNELRYFWCDVGGFSGRIPSLIGDMTQLIHLNIGINALTGNVPPSIADLTRLTFLSLGSNELTGTVPSSLCSIVTSGIYIDCGVIQCDCCKTALPASGPDPGVFC